MNPYPPPTFHPSRGSLPILISVPHSGRLSDEEVIANAVQGRLALATLEDPIVDRLCWRVINAGVSAVVQHVPRAIIDCNRDETEVDPAVIRDISPAPVGPRARHGLGLIPSRTYRHGALWRRRIDRTELARRIAQVHRPYHEAIANGLKAMSGRYGEVGLIDCHSMPHRRGQADVVIGDRHGSSAAGWFSAEAARLIRGAGFRVAMNDPYAGGAIVSRHGNPAGGTQAIQLEIDRSVYLARDQRTAGPGFDCVSAMLENLTAGLGQALIERGLSEAAE